MVSYTKNDLEFILKQIKIAEAHAAGTPLNEIYIDEDGDIVPEGTPGALLAISHPLVPFGLRTVDGSFNNLTEGQSHWGASDHPFVRITEPFWRNEEDDSIVFGAGSPNPVTMTNNNYGAPGTMVDADPRLISNLIVDQTLDNPAAIYAALTYAGISGGALSAAQAAISAAHAANEAGDVGADAALQSLLDQYGVEMEGNTISLPNVAPDEGLSAPFNSWFTLFGQFFDHGLDLVAKKGGTIYIPLAEDDPLYVEGSPTNFMAVTRTLDGANNTTSPFVDQNQTYGSTASKQLFMREYEAGPDGPVSTGRLLEGEHGMSTWADVKEQAELMLGFKLTDADIGAIPLFAMDSYGEFIRGENGLPQIVAGYAPDGEAILVEGNLDNPVDPSAIDLPDGTQLKGSGDTIITIAPGQLVQAVRTDHAFLDDIAHAAVPVLSAGVLQADDDSDVGYSGGFNTRGGQTAYDNELLDAHYITGDGRGNENIGLTAVHHVFHSEHNRLVEQVKEEALASGDLDFLNEWLLDPVMTFPADGAGLNWDGERLFQAARFTNEMEYQHLVFEEFARKVQPDVDAFVFNASTDVDPAIFAEFAHVIYRFGHSMLTETVDRTYADGTNGDIDLFSAFLNPLQFGGLQLDDAGDPILDSNNNPIVLDHDQAAGAIIRGMTAQTGNEIDEFVTHVLRNQLVGIPLDLAAINIARGRETGIPPLNEARRQFQEIANGDTQLDAYTSWTDFALNMKNPASIVNFIAAYGTHDSILAADTIEGKRDAAMLLVFGGEGAPTDRVDFLNSTGSWARQAGEDGIVGTVDDLRDSGLEDVDLWVGGLAEKKMAFGGMLGSTFSFVFELQLENLQNGDRFYYLSRVQGLNLLNELENNSLAKMVLNNTDLGESGYALPGDIFSVPDQVLYMDMAMQERFGIGPDPVHDDPILGAISDLVERVDANEDGVAEYLRVNSNDHYLIQGSEGADHIVAGGGDDSVWGRGGNDRIEAGYGVDKIHGGAGDDIITNNGTDVGETDMLHGEEGNDVIHGGSGLALIFGNQGQDFIIAGPDGKEVFGGTGNDFILGGEGGDFLLGNEGDDWIEAGNGFDTTAGDNSELFFNSPIIGHDVMFSGQNEHDFDAESGDDIMIQGESVIRNEGMWGFDWVGYKGNRNEADVDLARPIFTTDQEDILRNRFDQVEGASGWDQDDVITGDDRTNIPGPNADPEDPLGAEINLENNELTQAGVDRIDGLREILGDWAAAPTGGDRETQVAFDGGNILIGGGGSDTIEGRGGNDVIDGDSWLNVRIRFEHEGQNYSTDGMTANIYRESQFVEGRVAAGTAPAFGGKSLDELALAGTINPGQLGIVREIVQDDGVGDIDTAVFSGNRDEYDVSANVDGSYTVAHTGGLATDGVDKVSNVEVLRFADMDVLVSADGFASLSDQTPTEGQTISISELIIHDANGIDPLVYQWQSSSDGGVTWTDIAGANNATFVPQDLPGQAFGAQAGQQIRVQIGYVDGAGINELIYSAGTGPVGVNWQGDASANTLDGTVGDDIGAGAGGADRLNGSDGNDRLIGDGGNDRLDGGAGVDTTVGGTGNDTHFVDNADDIVVELAGEGSDIVRANTSYTLAAGVAVETLRVRLPLDDQAIDLFGNELSNTILGNAGQNVLGGGAGNDRLDGLTGADRTIGGLGNDRHFVDNVADVVVEAVGEGNDRVLASTSYVLSSDAEVEFLQTTDADGTDDIDLTGNGFANRIDGNAGSNTLSGGGGNDVLDGLGGADITDGGLGDDAHVVDDAGDVVIESAGEGNDRVHASTSFALTAGAEVEVLTTNNTNGTDAIDLTGNEFANNISGNAGSNILTGGGGDDFVHGRDGDDSIRQTAGTDGSDSVNGGRGLDTYVLTLDVPTDDIVIYTRNAWLAVAGNEATSLSGSTEIVVTRNGSDSDSIIAQLDNVEEIVVDSLEVSRTNGPVGNGNNISVIGDFRETSLNYNTITVNGASGTETVDISGLTSDHRLVFNSGGGNDSVIGGLRPQDQFNTEQQAALSATGTPFDQALIEELASVMEPLDRGIEKLVCVMEPLDLQKDGEAPGWNGALAASASNAFSLAEHTLDDAGDFLGTRMNGMIFDQLAEWGLREDMPTYGSVASFYGPWHPAMDWGDPLRPDASGIRHEFGEDLHLV